MSLANKSGYITTLNFRLYMKKALIVKKAKITLIVTSLTLVVGGVFALNAKRVSPDLFYCDEFNICQLTDRFTDIPNGVVVTAPYQLYVSTSTLGATCNTADCPKLSPSTKHYKNL